MLNETLRNLGWPTQIALPEWAERAAASRPWTIIVFPAVRAQDGEEAAGIARTERDRIGAVLALNRGAGGRAIATVVEEIVNGQSSPRGYLPEDETYTGNLMGGFVAGEDHETLLMQRLALDADPMLALVMSLYGKPSSSATMTSPSFGCGAFLRFFQVIGSAQLNQPLFTSPTAPPGLGSTTPHALPHLGSTS